MLLSDLQHDFVRSWVTPLQEADPARLRGLVEELRAEGEEQLRREGVERERMEYQVALDLRYLKQYHEVTLPVALDRVTTGDLAAIAHDFHAEHNRLFG